MTSLLTRGTLVDLAPAHFLDGEEGFTCSKCNESFSQDTESFPHPDQRFVCLRICGDCNEAE